MTAAAWIAVALLFVLVIIEKLLILQLFRSVRMLQDQRLRELEEEISELEAAESQSGGNHAS